MDEEIIVHGYSRIVTDSVTDDKVETLIQILYNILSNSDSADEFDKVKKLVIDLNHSNLDNFIRDSFVIDNADEFDKVKMCYNQLTIIHEDIKVKT